MDLKKLMNQSFLTRTISGVVLVAILLLVGIVGGNLLYAFTLLISLIGVFEMLGVLHLQKSIIGSVAYVGTFVYYLLIYATETENIDVFIIGYLIVVLAVYVFTYPKYKTEEVLLSYFSVIYAAVLMSFIYQVRMYDDGILMVWLIFICSWGCDTCAYLTGVTCGKHKMAPVLSPKKSVEGGIGGVVGAILLGALYGFLMRNENSYFDNPVLMYGIICGIGALISMVGDLAASAVKRNYGIKDYGKLIPGHGGILDRFDSVLFTAPVIYYLITFMA
jgi:phosphatidate cytidylyltransferase